MTRLAAAVLLLHAHAASAQVDAVNPQREAEPAQLLSPRLGRPVFVEPGRVLTIVAIGGASAGDVSAWLQTSRFPAHRHALALPDGAAEKLAAGLPLDVLVPEGIPEQTYDLELRVGQERILERHCVAVTRVCRGMRIVHLMDMQVGEMETPRFNARLAEELNLLAPTLIVATGDYVSSLHPDPGAGWSELVEFVQQCDAPLLMACGDEDDLNRYSRLVSASPIGVVEYGRYRGIVIHDVADRPVHDDLEQMQWIERTLPAADRDSLTFLVSHDPAVNLLREWRTRGVVAEAVRAGRLGLWFVGGDCDAVRQPDSDLVSSAAPMLVFAASGTDTETPRSARGGWRYRIVDLEDDRATVPRDGGDPRHAAPIPAGSVFADSRQPNDGSSTSVSVWAGSRLDFPLRNLVARVIVKRSGQSRPWCQGATLQRLVEYADFWECRVGFDLPDRGAAFFTVGTGPPPAAPALTVAWDVPTELRFVPNPGVPGLGSGLLGGQAVPAVVICNDGAKETVVEPLLRLDGNALSYMVEGVTEHPARVYRIHLAAGQSARLLLDLSAARVQGGRRELQLYLRGAWSWSPARVPLWISVQGEPAVATPAGPDPE